MNKKIKYFVSSVLSAFTFYLFLGLPYEVRYYGLLVGIVMQVFLFWFGLGIVFRETVYTRLMSVLLPVGFLIGFGLFAVLLPSSLWVNLLISVFYGGLIYIMFLVENVFLVAIGYRTVPLYRAAYTVSLILMLLVSFFLFDSLFSFNFIYYINAVAVLLLAALLFSYQFWAVAIELSDDGKTKNKLAYTLVPSLVVAQFSIIFSFWPVGIFKASIYLVAVIYVLLGLIQADIRERLFRRTWLTAVWIGAAVLAGMVLMTRWK